MLTPAAVSLSEEGLAGGKPTDLSGETDTTNATTVTGQLGFSDADTNDTHTFTFTKPAVALTSDGLPITWSLSNDAKTLQGYVTGDDGDRTVITATITNKGEYGVTLLGPVDHPVKGSEDVLAIDLGVQVEDRAGSTAQTKLSLKIEDDSPVVFESEVVTSVSAIGLPDIFAGNVSFVGNGNTKHDKLLLNNGAVEVTAKGFTSEKNLTLKDAQIGQGSNGIGVASKAAPYHNIEQEVDYRKTANGQGASEELTIRLTGGKVAYGASIEFAAMFGGEKEIGEVIFYRGDEQVAIRSFTSNAASGNYAANFEVHNGGFDRIVLRAKDNGDNISKKDNSDFSVKGIEFFGTTDVLPIATAQGKVSAEYGADGKGINGGLFINDTSVDLITSDGQEIITGHNAATGVFEGRDSNGKLVFEVHITQDTGKWEMVQYQPLKPVGDGTSLGFEFTITDADGDSASGTFQVAPVLAVLNEAPTIDDASVELAEAALGAASVIASGQLKIGDANVDDQLTVTLVAPPDSEQSLTSGGKPVEWVLSTDGKTLQGNADGKTVIKATVDDEGKYSVELKGAIDHPSSGSDNVPLQIGVRVNDGKLSTDANLVVNLKDDAPIAHDISEAVGVEKVFYANVMISLDLSGSMDYSSGLKGMSRLDVAKTAINQMLSAYQQQLDGADKGAVKVNFTTFSDGSKQRSDGWIDIADARAILAKLDANGGTNYDAALQELIDSFNPKEYGKNAPVSALGTQNVSYFLSDGEPTIGNGWNDRGAGIADGNVTGFDPDSINGKSEVGRGDWEAFLAKNGVISYAIGLGSNVNESALRPIAYDGANGRDDNGRLVKVVNDFSDLGDVLIGTTPVVSGVGGSLVGGDASFGGDGGHIASITIDGKVYSYDGSSLASDAPAGWSMSNDGVLTVATEAGGTIQVDMNSGDYYYKPATGTVTSAMEKVDFVLVDGDGDTATAELNIDLSAIQIDKPTITGEAAELELSNDASDKATGNLGIAVGRDVDGSHVTFVGSDDQSLDGKTVMATVKVGGKDVNVELTSGDTRLVYKTLENGSVVAVREGSTDEVFRLTGKADEGTYSVEMVRHIDAIGTVELPAQNVEKQVTVTNTVAAAGDVTLAISAFLDKGGDVNVKDGSDSEAGVVINDGAHRGISVDNRQWNDRDESNSIGKTDGSGGSTHGEKLALDFLSADPTVKVNKVELTLNQFGDRSPDVPEFLWFGTKRVAEEDTITYTVFERDSAKAPQVVTITAQSVGKGGSANHTTGTQDIIITGTDIVRIVIGAGDNATEFSVDENIKVTYEKIPTVAVDEDSDFTLNLGAIVTDGNGSDGKGGDSASTDLTIIIDNEEPVVASQSEDGVLVEGVALTALAAEGEAAFTDNVDDAEDSDTPVAQADAAAEDEAGATDAEDAQTDSDTLASLLGDDSDAILLDDEADGATVAHADAGNPDDAVAARSMLAAGADEGDDVTAGSNADEGEDAVAGTSAETANTDADSIDAIDVLDFDGDGGSIDSILGSTKDEASAAKPAQGGASNAASAPPAGAAAAADDTEMMRAVAQQVVQQAQNTDMS